MEKDEVFAGDDVRDAIAVVSDWTETATGRDAVGMFGQIQARRLAVRRLRGGQAPRFAQHFLQEGRIHFQVLGHDVEAKQVSINAFATHGILIASLVLSAGQLQQTDPLRFLFHPITVTKPKRMDSIIAICGEYQKRVNGKRKPRGMGVKINRGGLHLKAEVCCFSIR